MIIGYRESRTYGARPLIDIGRGLLEALKILKAKRGTDEAAIEITGGGRRSFPLPIFRMSVGKNEHATILMRPGREVQPLIELGGIKENAFVNGHCGLVNKR